MKPTNLEWEDVSKFEEIKGYGQHVWRHHEKYFFVTDEGGIAEQRVVYEFPLELFQLLKSGEKTLKEIHFKLKKDCWPPTEEERKESRRKFISKYPASLIDVPKNRKLFSKEELEELIPIAEKQWIESEGELPDDYVSPLK